MAVVVVSLVIALVEPLLVIALQLVIEAHAVAAVLEALCLAQIGAEDLGVVFQLPLAFEARVEGLVVALVAVAMALEQVAPFLGQHDRVVPVARHSGGFDQALLAKMPQVTGTRIGRTVMMVPQVTTGDDPERTDRRERARFGAAQRVLSIAVANHDPLQSARQIEVAREHVPGIDVALTRITVALGPASVITIAAVLVGMRVPRLIRSGTAAEFARILITIAGSDL